MEIVTVAQAKGRFPAIIAEVTADNSVVGITVRGRLAAVLISASDYEELTAIVRGLGGDPEQQENAARRAGESDVVKRHLQHFVELSPSHSR